MTAVPEQPRAGVYRQLRYERPSGTTEILLVRHGESAPADIASPFPLVGGRGDPELSPLGRAQSEAVAGRLARFAIDAIYVTELRRTAQTAAPLARKTGVHPVVEPGLNEIHLGEWEGGLYRQRVVEQDPLAVRVFAEQRWDVVPGAESNEALTARTSDAIRRIAEAHRDGRVVAFTHAVAISSVLGHATGATPFGFLGADNTSISAIVVSPDRWWLRRFNDAAHLEGLDV